MVENRYQDCGCIYVAYGFEFWIYAANSARTIKNSNPGLSVTLITNVPIKNPKIDGQFLFDQIILRDAESGENRTDKLTVDLLSPYEKTLYLDCDTEIYRDLYPIFRLLDRYDIAVRQLNIITKKKFDILPGLQAYEAGLSEWNTGVIFFRKTKAVNELFTNWREIFFREGMKKDQPAFMRAFLNTPGLSLLPLNPAWNIKPTKTHERSWIFERPLDIRIFHYRNSVLYPKIANNLYKLYKDLSGYLNNYNESPLLKEEIRLFNIKYFILSKYLFIFNNPPLHRLYLNKQQLFMLPLGILFRILSILVRRSGLSVWKTRKEYGDSFEKVK